MGTSRMAAAALVIVLSTLAAGCGSDSDKAVDPEAIEGAGPTS